MRRAHEHQRRTFTSQRVRTHVKRVALPELEPMQLLLTAVAPPSKATRLAESAMRLEYLILTIRDG